MSDYRVFLSLEAAFILRSFPKTTQYSLLAFLNYLESNPFDEGDFISQKDANKREYCIKGIKRHLISYYVDHAGKEVKVTTISKNKILEK